MAKKPVVLSGSPLSLSLFKQLAQKPHFTISAAGKKNIEESRRCVDILRKKKTPLYGINTGFGFLANKTIPLKKQRDLQVNVIRSHASGFGEVLDEEECRIAAILRLNVFLKGNSGVSLNLCNALASMLQQGITPCIPSKGSLGASGDLAPLAHLALPLIGEGEVYYKKRRQKTKKVFRETGFKPISLGVKEGLGLINGTQVMLAVGGLALFDALNLVHIANRAAALTFEGFLGNPEALDPLIHKARGHRGQIASAAHMQKELSGSSITQEKKKFFRFLQDPYSLRTAPQVHGAVLDVLAFAASLVEKESGASTDNPLVFPKENKILSGGNFHGEPLAFAFDMAAMGVSELASISERRLELLLNPTMSGLNAFLAKNPGLESGYMATQYLSASLVAENKILSHPASTDSIPGNAGIEDHVSLGMTSALKLKACVKNVKTVLAIELINAAQAIDLRKRSKKLGEGTIKTYKDVRKSVPFLDKDRIVAQDIKKSYDLIEKYIDDLKR